MNNGNFISIDPGSSDPTGVAIFDQTGKLLLTGSVRYFSAVNYAEQFGKIIKKHDIRFAMIENFVVFSGMKRHNSFKVQAQVQQLSEIFEHHIMINPAQWNGQKWKDAYKRKIALDIFGKQFNNSHETDAALMGDFIFRKAQVSLGEAVWEALNWLARTKKKWPTMKEQSLYYLYQNYIDSLKAEKRVAV